MIIYDKCQITSMSTTGVVAENTLVEAREERSVICYWTREFYVFRKTRTTTSFTNTLEES